jgi:cell division protein FtsW
MGFVGAALVLLLFGLLAWYGIKISSMPATASGDDGRGATFLIVGQAVGNIAMVSGLLPVTGIPLPFISFGGTSLVVNLLATGLLISIGRLGGRSAKPAGEGGPDKESTRLKLVNRRFGRK